jgi:CTP synthase
MGSNNAIVIHLTLIPFLAAAGELKTKPTQHSVKMLLEYGIQPDILVCRTEHSINLEIRKKIALFCNVHINSVIESIDASTIYDVPLLMLKENLDKTVLTKLKLPLNGEPDLDSWKAFLGRLKNPTKDVRIGLVGKYVELPDAYKSITESFIHAGAANECKVHVEYIHSENINADNVKEKLGHLHGVLVAPGFGSRGIEGKLDAIKYVRENNIPFFGICLGMQCAVIEFARNVLKMKGAHSSEMDETSKYPVIDMMEEQKKIKNKGGTMRLGSYTCEIQKGSKAYHIYGKSRIKERHRHRYEFNNKYMKQFNDAGMLTTGMNPDTNLVEIIELKNHPFFVGGQFHPELKSTVANPHPLFVKFVEAASEYKYGKRK